MPARTHGQEESLLVFMSAALKRKLRRHAKRHNLTMADVIRNSLEEKFKEERRRSA